MPFRRTTVPATGSRPSLDELRRIAHRTKDVLLGFDHSADPAQSILRHGDNVQTSLDKEIDAYLQKWLPTIWEAIVVSEERDLGAVALDDLFWLVDPVDGTINEISGTADWAVSVALIDASTMQPVVGVVHIPLYHEIFVAVAGSGVELNDTPLTVSAPRRNVRGYSTPIISFGVPSRIAAISDKMAQTLASIMRKGWVTRQTGSAAVDICRVARGSWSAFFEYDLMYWDVAAAVLIAREAGCRVTLPDTGRLSRVGGLSKPRDVLVAASDRLVTELGKITTIKEVSDVVE